MNKDLYNISHLHVRNSIALKKNRASDNKGKIHSFLMCRIWIYSQIIGHQTWCTFGIFFFFEKLGSFRPFSSTSVLAALENEKKTELQHLVLPGLKCLKRVKKSPSFQKKKCQMHPNSDVQLWNWFLTINSDSTHQKWMKFVFIVTGSIFLQSYWVLDMKTVPFNSFAVNIVTNCHETPVYKCLYIFWNNKSKFSIVSIMDC